MKKFIYTLLLFSTIFSQDKIILKSGEEIIFEDRTNYYDYNFEDSFIFYDSKYFSKKNIAQLKLDNGDIIFKSGMPFSKYESLSIKKKAKADKRTSSKKFKNINQTLLDGLNEEQKQIYLIAYDRTISSPVKFFCISGGACSIVTITILLANPALFLPRF